MLHAPWLRLSQMRRLMAFWQASKMPWKQDLFRLLSWRQLKQTTQSTPCNLSLTLSALVACLLAYLCCTIAGKTFRLGEPLLGSAGCVLHSVIKYLFRSHCTSPTQPKKPHAVESITCHHVLVFLTVQHTSLVQERSACNHYCPRWHLCCTSSSVPAVVCRQRPASRFQTGAGQAATRRRR